MMKWQFAGRGCRAGAARASDIARSVHDKRAASVRPVLDALAGVGLARRLNDGRYAA